uniref:Transmembrane protein n=1 Tax=Glossina brevipalpis TaxID=37001 RepID=A0A1A9W9W5_9MUSC
MSRQFCSIALLEAKTRSTGFPSIYLRKKTHHCLHHHHHREYSPSNANQLEFCSIAGSFVIIIVVLIAVVQINCSSDGHTKKAKPVLIYLWLQFTLAATIVRCRWKYSCCDVFKKQHTTYNIQPVTSYWERKKKEEEEIIVKRKNLLSERCPPEYANK